MLYFSFGATEAAVSLHIRMYHKRAVHKGIRECVNAPAFNNMLYIFIHYHVFITNHFDIHYRIITCVIAFTRCKYKSMCVQAVRNLLWECKHTHTYKLQYVHSYTHICIGFLMELLLKIVRLIYRQSCWILLMCESNLKYIFLTSFDCGGCSNFFRRERNRPLMWKRWNYCAGSSQK